MFLSHIQPRAGLPALARDAIFATGCALLFASITLALPSYFPLIEPDSGGYVDFFVNRTAIYPLFLRFLRSIGLTLDQIVYVQLGLFSISLAILIAALRRMEIRRRWLIVFVILLAANTYFSSFQRTILSESLSFSALMIGTAFVVDYLRTGRGLFLAVACLFIGLNIGIRPAGLMFAPIIPFAVLLKRKQRNVSPAILILLAVVPMASGWVIERGLYRLEHGNRSASIVPYLLAGKAAMLARDDMVFAGPHAAALSELGDKLYRSYVPVHAFLSDLPSWTARPVLTAFYEGVGQFQVIDRDLLRLAREEGTTADVLRTELGKQVIASNPLAFVRLSLIHYLGQWSIRALAFPPTANAVSAYLEHARIPLHDMVTGAPFGEKPSFSSLFVYPAFLAAGILTFALALLLPGYLIWPPAADSYRRRDLMVAALFAAMCHLSMLLTSVTNVSTPRFLMMVYPHILLAVLFLCCVLWPRQFGSRSNFYDLA